MTEFELRQAILAAARGLLERKLTAGRSGNVSARRRDGFLITPSGMPYASLEPGDVVHLGADGSSRGSRRVPSTEWRMHASIYRDRPEIGAIVHAHPIYATALACAGRAIPAFHYMVAVAGGDTIPLAPYATFGSEELARSAAATLAGHRACLLAQHGAVALAATPATALELMDEVEWVSQQYWATLAVGGGIPLPPEEMRRIHERFERYGQPGEREPGGRPGSS